MAVLRCRVGSGSWFGDANGFCVHMLCQNFCRWRVDRPAAGRGRIVGPEEEEAIVRAPSDFVACCGYESHPPYVLVSRKSLRHMYTVTGSGNRCVFPSAYCRSEGVAVAHASHGSCEKRLPDTRTCLVAFCHELR